MIQLFDSFNYLPTTHKEAEQQNTTKAAQEYTTLMLTLSAPWGHIRKLHDDKQRKGIVETNLIIIRIRS